MLILMLIYVSELCPCAVQICAVSGKMDSSDLLSKVVGSICSPSHTTLFGHQIFLFIPFPLSTKFSYLYPFPYLSNFPTYTLSSIALFPFSWICPECPHLKICHCNFKLYFMFDILEQRVSSFR